MSDRDSELGGMWIRESKAGKKYMSGQITVGGRKIDIVMFRNTHKQPGERTPDFRLYESKPQEQQDRPMQRRGREPEPDLDQELGGDRIPW